MKTLFLYVRFALGEVAQLKNPVADAALAGLLIKLLPFVHVDTNTLVGVCLAVGIIAGWMQNVLADVPSKVRSAKNAPTPPTPPTPGASV